MKQFWTNFIALPNGIMRLITAFSVIPPLVIYNYHKYFIYQIEELSTVFIIYWSLVFIGCWVYAGFPKKKKERVFSLDELETVIFECTEELKYLREKVEIMEEHYRTVNK